MMAFVASVLGSFTTPMRIGTDSGVHALAAAAGGDDRDRLQSHEGVPHPAVALHQGNGVLFGSIIVFIVVAAVILYGITWVVTGQLPALLNNSTF